MQSTDWQRGKCRKKELRVLVDEAKTRERVRRILNRLIIIIKLKNNKIYFDDLKLN